MLHALSRAYQCKVGEGIFFLFSFRHDFLAFFDEAHHALARLGPRRLAEQLKAFVDALDLGLGLAEMHLDGRGTPRNAIEAAVLVWRVAHGAWSIYDPQWGLCKVCEDTSAQESALDQRLTRELTSDQRREAAAIIVARFPDIVGHVRNRNAQLLVAGALLFAFVAGALLLRVRSASRRRS